MKKIFISLMMVLASSASDAQQVEFFDGNWQQANDMALKESKYIFVDAYTEWCGWCKVMDEKMFTDPQVAPFINEHFLPLKIDFEDSLGILLSKKFRVWAYPTTLLFNSMGQLVSKFSGYYEDHDKYLRFLKEAIAIKEEMVFNYDSKELDLPYPLIYTESFRKGKERKWPADSVVAAYLESQDDLFTEINWSVILRFHPASQEDFVIQNIDEYTKRYGVHESSDFIYSAIYTYVKKAVDENNRTLLDQALALCDKLEDPESARINYLMFYYEEMKDWKGYADALGSFIKLKGFSDHMKVNNSCWVIYENADDQDIVIMAVNWMKTVIDEHPIWMYLDTYAALLYKSGNLEEAIKYVDLAIEAGKQEGQKDISETEKLREKIDEAIKGKE